MSASNWATCPRCLDAALTERDAAFQQALSLYGVVPLAEFEAARAAAEAIRADPEGFQTFREDYEIFGASAGTVTVSYGGYCSVCGLSLDFEYERHLYGPGAEPA